MTKKYDVKPDQARALEDLENLIGKSIPRVEEIKLSTFGVKIEGKNVIGLGLCGQRLSTLPESIGDLKSLEYLHLINNQLTTLPESIGNLKSLEILYLEENQLSALPKSISNLKNLQKLNLNWNKLSTFPESIINLKTLQTLDLSYNQLTTLPESIGDLKSLEYLDLRTNQLTTLPESFWRLKNLETLYLHFNPWEGAWKGIEEYTIQTVLERSRQRAPIIIFISHSKGDKKQYRVSNLKNELKEQEEIREVHVSGEHDISESQLVLFIATKKSMKDETCLHELKLAKTHGIGIIPIKGTDISFEDLSQIDLGENYRVGDQLGLAFNDANFEHFCDELYEHIKKYKREVNLFESEERKIDKQWENIKISGKLLVESERFKEKFHAHIKQFEQLFEDLRSSHISPFEFLLKCAQLLNS